MERFQNRLASITGPKAAPKPAQAKDTMPKMELSGSRASITPSTATITTVQRATAMLVLSDIFTPNTSITDIAITPAAAADSVLVDQLLAAFASLQFERGGFVFDKFAVHVDLFKALAAAKDSTGRKLLPYMNPSNASGSSRGRVSSLDIQGVEGIPSWALGATSTNVQNSWLFDSESVHGWASAPQRLDFQYRVAYVDLAIWGYHAVAISDTTGVRQVTYDGTA